MIGVDALILLGFVFNIMNYSEKLKSPKWQKKRLEILNRDNFKCCLCGDTETELHVHHLKYSGPNPENAPNENLETLCKHCHWAKTFLDKNDFRPFVSAKKINNRLITLESDGGITVFGIEDNDDLTCFVSFVKNSPVMNELISMVNDNWELNK